MTRALVPARKTQLPAEPMRVYPTPIILKGELTDEPPEAYAGVGLMLAYILAALIVIAIQPVITGTREAVRPQVARVVALALPSSPQERSGP